MLVARPAAGAATKVKRQMYTFDPTDDLVDHVDSEVRGLIGVIVLRANFRVHEQAKVRIIDLDDIGSGITKQLDLASQKGYAGFNERFAGGVGSPRFLVVLQPFAEQPWRWKRHLDLPVRGRA